MTVAEMFKYLGNLFTSDGFIEHDINKWISDSSVTITVLLCSG